MVSPTHYVLFLLLCFVMICIKFFMVATSFFHARSIKQA